LSLHKRRLVCSAVRARVHLLALYRANRALSAYLLPAFCDNALCGFTDALLRHIWTFWCGSFFIWRPLVPLPAGAGTSGAARKAARIASLRRPLTQRRRSMRSRFAPYCLCLVSAIPYHPLLRWDGFTARRRAIYQNCYLLRKRQTFSGHSGDVVAGILPRLRYAAMVLVHCLCGPVPVWLSNRLRQTSDAETVYQVAALSMPALA